MAIKNTADYILWFESIHNTLCTVNDTPLSSKLLIHYKNRDEKDIFMMRNKPGVNFAGALTDSPNAESLFSDTLIPGLVLELVANGAHLLLFAGS